MSEQEVMDDVKELAGFGEETALEEKTVYELFKWSILLKGAISLAEVVVGILLLLIPPARVISLVQSIAAQLEGHTHDPITTHIVEELTRFGTGAAVFVALYLLSRGLIKCGLIWALLRNVLWAYPASLIVLGLFLVYQIYEIVTKGSIFAIGISIFDIIVVYLIWREWRIVKRHRQIS